MTQILPASQIKVNMVHSSGNISGIIFIIINQSKKDCSEIVNIYCSLWS